MSRIDVYIVGIMFISMQSLSLSLYLYWSIAYRSIAGNEVDLASLLKWGRVINMHFFVHQTATKRFLCRYFFMCVAKPASASGPGRPFSPALLTSSPLLWFSEGSVKAVILWDSLRFNKTRCFYQFLCTLLSQDNCGREGSHYIFYCQVWGSTIRSAPFFNTVVLLIYILSPGSFTGT